MSIESGKVGGVDYRNIELDTLRNNSYRRVIYTVPGCFQNVLMSVAPGETIPSEVHRNAVQFVRVEKGSGLCTVDGVEYQLFDEIEAIEP